ncbi:E3 ubiquitin-protein ligase RNF217 [Genypterus blacodes]|uniref:E3 ubiquitin-protein ligase RNF217 n=1 Tax=Genypterus blacodes TaxID=154954 RepID=UPI003F76FA4B
MEEDPPLAGACEMPSFISSFEEGRARLSRNLPVETSSIDGKVERSSGGVVSRSSSVLSGNGGEKTGDEEEGEKDAEESNNNNNCNSGGEERRRASAVEILRRNFGVSIPKSPSLLLNTADRMQPNVEEDNKEEDEAGGDAAVAERGSEEADVETGEGETKNEPTLIHRDEVTGSDVLLSASGRRCYVCDGDSGASDEHSHFKEHVYCTVYCIDNDIQRQEATDVSDAGDTESERGHDPSLGSEPVLYTLDDLVDPRGDLTRQVSPEEAGADAAVQCCRVCLEENPIASLPCCRKAVCDECLKLYVSSQVRVGKALISCPILECSGSLEEGAILAHLASEDVAKYRYFLELSQLDASTKPCPQCSYFTSLKKQPVASGNASRSEQKYKIQCVSCQFVWCFKCHAPWHSGIRCREYRKGDKLLRSWASGVEHGQRNAQKCPRCKIHIQRTEGCDHMTCTQCNTNFCYRCGERYRHLRFIGDHTSNLSVFGCKYRYLPDKPHLRRLIRGSVCASKLLIAPVVIVLVVVLGSLALFTGLLVFPVYYVCKRRKKQNSQGSGRWI